MKKWMWVVIAVIIAVGVGGYSYTRYRLQEQSYTTEMKAGKEALQAKDYTQAETNFTHASRTKANDTTAQRYLTQTQTYVGGTESLKSREFSAAKSAFKTVKNTTNASSVLVSRSKDQLATIKKVLAKRKTYKTQYQNALELNKANEFTDSNSVANVMLKDSELQKSYYQDLYQQAKSLRKQNTASIKAVTGSTPITNSAQSATSSNSSSSKQQTTTVSGDQSQANSAAKTTVSGNYSDAQIKATRAELNEAGMKDSNYSDSQIEGILQRSAQEHISIAQAAKTGSYSADQIQATRSELDQAGFNSNSYTDSQIEAILQQASAQHMSIAQAAKSLQ
ncbi:cell surface protein [Lactiplantibacillus garii]|uniref:Cell surface protein n=1 Tax=Lactiplantibacillus garii TaxID=2306423 RepID=A0A426D4E0_9LACO|nr:cell surface protein [Lactiplantibacillus garii]RRK09462.1 cell surface protein [Lactiplantibacillus garii]